MKDFRRNRWLATVSALLVMAATLTFGSTTQVGAQETNQECHPSYSGCLPFVEDIDCLGGLGNGPVYLGSIIDVIGPDVYGLDANENGLGCENRRFGLSALTDGQTASTTDVAGPTRHADEYATHLSGSRAVPSVAGNGLGWSTWKVSADGTRIDYRMIYKGIDAITAMHLHQAPTGRTGAVIVPLDISNNQRFDATHRIITGSFTVADFSGDFDGRLMAGLQGAIESGSVYVNVHTQDQPAGAIRGQLRIWER